MFAWLSLSFFLFYFTLTTVVILDVYACFPHFKTVFQSASERKLTLPLSVVLFPRPHSQRGKPAQSGKEGSGYRVGTSKMLKRSCLVHDLSGKLSSVSPLSIMFPVGFLYLFFIRLKMSSLFLLYSVFMMNECWIFVQCFSCIYV